MIEFTPDEKTAIVHKIQAYFSKELDQELGQFDTEFLLDFFTREVGNYFYNRGLFDAQAVLESRMDHLAEAIGELEQVIA